MKALALGLTLVAAATVAGCSRTAQVAQPATPDPVASPAPAFMSDTLNVDQVAGPDPSVVIDRGPIVTRKVPPAYPDLGRSQGVQGLVRVQALFGAEGRVEDTRMVQSIPLLDEAAMAAVRQWEFMPAIAQGKPVSVWATVPVRFSLH